MSGFTVPFLARLVETHQIGSDGSKSLTYKYFTSKSLFLKDLALHTSLSL
jgi:hypothetical protein